MNTAPLEFVAWPWRRWFYCVGLVFLTQVVVIFFLAERPSPPSPGPQFRTRIKLAVDPASEQPLAGLPALSDPTLFALPNLHGFSGAAWLTFPPLEQHFTDWSEPPHWLELDPARLGKDFLASVGTNIAAPLLVADKPLPSLPGPNPVLTNGPATLRSEIRIEGDLARRALLRPAVLPSWAHSDILTNTVVQLLVDANGDPQLRTLLSSCGHSEADQFALKLAASARFQPLPNEGGREAPSSSVTWGKMIFQWHTIPLPATNTLSTP
jgi:TonB family protein